ncbi:MAG: DNA replication/repair protein RecF, partial [Candidatus Rokubacteria bacterium]|nr:DNA replication/repair protein RecF [Candidatus Rokubacteria bacterium]
LEALAVLLTGRSFRTTKLAELPAWGTETTSVHGEIRRTEGSRTLRRTIQRRQDGAWQSVGEDAEWARVVAFGWQDLEIVNGAPQARRNFLDGFALRLYPTHRAALVRYRQVLARRNFLLQQRLAEPVLAPRLAPWDEQLVTVGAEVIDRRRRAAAALQTELARIYPALAGADPELAGGRHKVEIRYRAASGETGDGEELARALAAARRAEMRRGQTLVGPHRDDLAIELDARDARAFGSRGQQRLLALALRLAEVLPITDAVGTVPVLLLDDALSELDPEVRRHALREVESAEQVFLTSPEPLARVDGVHWIVAQGGIAAA